MNECDNSSCIIPFCGLIILKKVTPSFNSLVNLFRIYVPKRNTFSMCGVLVNNIVELK